MNVHMKVMWNPVTMHAHDDVTWNTMSILYSNKDQHMLNMLRHPETHAQHTTTHVHTCTWYANILQHSLDVALPCTKLFNILQHHQTYVHDVVT